MKKVRDPLHEYIYLTELEVAVSTDKVFLRLHHIHQNSFTFLTYPSTSNTRYPHSLGVMHIATTLFNNALANTPSVLGDLSATVGLFFEEQSRNGQDVPDAVKIDIGAIYDFDPGYRRLFASPNLDKHNNLILLILHQGLRFAALLHDVGHPPYSHIVEYALQQSIDEYQDHEVISEKIANNIKHRVIESLSRRGLSDDCFRSVNEFAKLSFIIAAQFLNKHTHETFAELKRTIHAGDIDADRLDYVQRDVAAAAIMTLSYDLGRIYDSCYLRKVRDNGSYEIAMTAGSLSAIEVLFQARFHLYRYMIYHHDVVRRNLAVQRVITLICTAPDSSPNELIAVRNTIRDWATNPDKLDRYYEFNDGFLLNTFYTTWNDIRKYDDQISEYVSEIKLFLDVILFRNNRRLKSFWKRADQYHNKCKEMFPDVESPIAYFNQQLELAYKPFQAFGKRGRLMFALALENEMNAQYGAKRGSRIYAYYFAEFKPAPETSFELAQKLGDSEKISVDKLSPTLSALRSAWKYSPQLMLYHEMDGRPRGMEEDRFANSYLKSVKAAVLILAMANGKAAEPV